MSSLRESIDAYSLEEEPFEKEYRSFLVAPHEANTVE